MGALVTPTKTPIRTRSISKKPSNVVRSDLWFYDGNIVLIASGVAFKVHRGQLRRHSEVFDDLFGLPQPQDQDLYDGCPWIELYDCPSDVLYFLRALYDGLYFKSPGAGDFPTIAAVLRLSTKYLVEHLRQRCMSRLELDWPSTLAGWDAREQAATDAHGHYAPRLSCPHPILVINLALELHLPFLLPAAIYDLARYGPSKIMAGAPAPIPFSFILAAADPQAASKHPASTLSQSFLIATYRGRESAQRFLADFVLKELQGRAPAPNCLHLEDEHQSRVCRESFYFIMLNVLRSVGGIACGRDADPLFTLVQAMDMLTRTDFSDGTRQCGLKMCHPCKVDFAKSATGARETAWSLLPEWFGLDTAVVAENTSQETSSAMRDAGPGP